MVWRPQHLYVFYGLCEKKFVQKLLQLLTIVRRKIRINSLNWACSVNRNYFLFFLLMSKNKSAKPPIAYKFRTALSCQGWYEFACENFVEKNFGCVASRGCSKDSNIFQESSNWELRNHNNVGGTFLSIAPRSCYMWVKSLKRVLYNYMQQCSDWTTYDSMEQVRVSTYTTKHSTEWSRFARACVPHLNNFDYPV